MIAIHICFDDNLLGIARVFSQVFKPCLMERMIPSLHNPEGTPGKIFSALIFLLLSRFVPDLMCITFKLNEKVANCLLNITQSGYLHDACDPIWSIVLVVFIKLETAIGIYFLGVAFGLSQVLGTREYCFCIKKISLILLPVVEMFLSLGEVKMGNGFLVLTG
jgi:hypothetical protein